MKKTSKFMALLAVVFMVTNCFMGMFVSNTYAIANVTVVFEADADSSFGVSQDGTTLTYHWSNGQQNENYDIKLKTNNKTTDAVFTKQTTGDAQNGFRDTYTATIASNEDAYIYSGNINLGNLSIKSDGNGVAIVEGYSTSLKNIKDATHYNFRVENINFGGGGGNQPAEPAGGPDNISIDAKFTDTHMIGYINNICFMDDAGGVFKDSYKGTVNGAGETGAGKTNTFRFLNVFGDYPVTEFTINGVKYKKGDQGVEDKGEEGYFITVPAAAQYTITGAADKTIEKPRTIIWVNPDYTPKDAADANWVKDFTVSNGYAKVVEVYDENNKLLDPKEYVGEHGDKNGLDKGFGWVKIFPGYRTVFEFTPVRGYQLTGISINESPLQAVKDVNRFEITLPKNPEGSGNLHFAATFTKTEDVVKANSTKVQEGAIALAANALDAGTAQLTVGDVELNSDKTKEFENAAGDLEIKNYLDISLYQVFYKGKKDSLDVWANQIEELNGEAEITLKLGDDVDVENVVLVHNIHDGKEFETIEIIRYDKEAHTITFKTKSFSNYAIAVKPATTNDAKPADYKENPDTGIIK